MSVTTTTEASEQDVDDFVDKLFTAVLGAQEVQAIHIGARLGWYDALAEHGPCTSTELADLTSTDERYAREWLEAQTVSGYLTCEDATVGATDRAFVLPAAHVDALTNRTSLAYVEPLARFIAGLGKHIDAIISAYRTGEGVSWAELGEDPREAQAAVNRPMFLNQLGQEYLPSIPDVDTALRAGGRVADIGCGAGWSAIGVATAYPDAIVDGFDLDEPSISMAKKNAAEAGVADRVNFSVADASDVSGDQRYDLVMALECIHDLPRPVDVLRAMRDLAGSSGAVIVMDERVGDEFTGEDDPVERIMYGYSLMCCLPDGRSEKGSVGTGTVMRAGTLRRYAVDAGFSDVEVLPIENDFFRFYRLVG